MTYLLDANVFIDAKNRHYGFDFCPGFWDWLVRANAEGRVFSVTKVGDELQDDDLAPWAKARGEGFFLAPTKKTLGAFQKINDWLLGAGYPPTAALEFQSVADFYLVAQALADGHAVVTHERPSGSLKRVKIPDVCAAVGVMCLQPFEMLRREKARFVLGS